MKMVSDVLEARLWARDALRPSYYCLHLEVPSGQIIMVLICLEAKLLWSWFALRPNYYGLGLEVPWRQIIVSLASMCFQAKLLWPWLWGALRPNYYGLEELWPWPWEWHWQLFGITVKLKARPLQLYDDNARCMFLPADLQQDIKTTAAVFCLSLSGSTACSTLYSRQTGDANMWDDLPFDTTSAQSLAVFRQRLKTFLFSRSYPHILIWFTYHYHCFFSFFSGISRGPWNNWYYLGHVKQVNDDDDGWWLVIDGWWLMVGDWWLVIDDWWYSNGWLNCVYRNEIDWQFIS